MRRIGDFLGSNPIVFHLLVALYCALILAGNAPCWVTVTVTAILVLDAIIISLQYSEMVDVLRHEQFPEHTNNQKETDNDNQA